MNELLALLNVVMTTCTSVELVATTYHSPPYGEHVTFSVNRVAYVHIPAPYHNHNLMLTYDRNMITVD
jgi:hypothetical protein